MEATTKLSPTAIWTFSGRTLEPLNPDPKDISIVDIAHHLSNICRFTGASSEFYSVAQHSVLVSDLVPEPFKLEALMHDSPEYGLFDVAKPVKNASGPLSEAYRAAEERLQRVIYQKFGVVSTFESHRRVKQADDLMLIIEGYHLMPPDFLSPEEKETFEIAQPEEYFDCWTPKNAKTNFLIKFAELTDNDILID